MLILYAILIAQVAYLQATEAPILDIENESIGYVGKISEHSVLVDLVPHLQIKNIEAINGICSYHVFKPNNEDFPFTVEIKDKSTGEAMVELIRKDLSTTTKNNVEQHAKSSANSILLNCNSRKSFDFLIQAHDCSMPSLYSNKVPVRIEVIDTDDFSLEFEKSEYMVRLVKSEKGYENFLTVKAMDYDCTNNGMACSYTLEHELYLSTEFPFKVNANGELSIEGEISRPRSYQFKVRAYDCVNKKAFVEANVKVEIVEPCVPEWTDYPREIIATSKTTSLFDQITPIKCDQPSTPTIGESSCTIDSASTILTLTLDPTITNTCVKSTDCHTSTAATFKKLVLFSGYADSEDDDSIEDSSYDSNAIDISYDSGVNLQPPLNYRSFSKEIENAQKINFDGAFGSDFTLSTWIRRPANADPKIKEQVFCGSDSMAMNRHHFGMYFYRGSVKFLMRKESDEHLSAKDVFYPSLWEWSLSEKILTDNKWHFYEIKLAYPKAHLFIDGVNFVENKTNSDIIDAYELVESDGSGKVASYVGACYHARTNSLVDHFEGDIGSVVLAKKEKTVMDKSECDMKCTEAIEMNMIGNEKYMDSIDHISPTEIHIHTSNLKDMSQILSKITYTSTGQSASEATHLLKLTSTIHCANTAKQITFAQLTFDITHKHQTHEYNVQLQGDKTQIATKYELENGIEPFRELSIYSYEINKIDQTALYEAETSDANNVMLAECRVRILPERNLMQPMQNFEKIMFLQNLLDEFKFEFKETLDTVLIRGVQTVKNYESFIRRLTYVVTNVKDIPEEKFIKDKQFFVSCVRNEPSIETNTVVIQINIVDDVKVKKIYDPNNRFGFVAHKQAQKFVVSESDTSMLINKMNMPHQFNLKTSKTSPLMVFLVAVCVCGMSFFVIMGAIRMSSLLSGRGRRLVPNEEAPGNTMDGMEWDDSGLNITENPLDKLEAKKDITRADTVDLNPTNFDSEYEYTSNEEDEEEYDSRYDEQYSSEEEQSGLPVPDRHGLEWDDTSVSNNLDSNKYV